MMRATVALLLLRGAGAVAPVGVCWTRNMVDNATARHDLRYVVAWLGRAPNARKPPCDWMTQYRGA